MRIYHGIWSFNFLSSRVWLLLYFFLGSDHHTSQQRISIWFSSTRVLGFWPFSSTNAVKLQERGEQTRPVSESAVVHLIIPVDFVSLIKTLQPLLLFLSRLLPDFFHHLLTDSYNSRPKWRNAESQKEDCARARRRTLSGKCKIHS